MTERPKFFDDIAGVAGGAMSALAGLREEGEAMVRARMDEAIRKFDLIKRDEFEAVQEMAANARFGQETAEARLSTALERLDALEKRVAKLEGRTPIAMPHGDSSDSGGGPGMIA